MLLTFSSIASAVGEGQHEGAERGWCAGPIRPELAPVNRALNAAEHSGVGCCSRWGDTIHTCYPIHSLTTSAFRHQSSTPRRRPGRPCPKSRSWGILTKLDPMIRGRSCRIGYWSTVIPIPPSEELGRGRAGRAAGPPGSKTCWVLSTAGSPRSVMAMPLLSHLADLLLAPSSVGAANLAREGLSSRTVVVRRMSWLTPSLWRGPGCAGTRTLSARVRTGGPVPAGDRAPGRDHGRPRSAGHGARSMPSRPALCPSGWSAHPQLMPTGPRTRLGLPLSAGSVQPSESPLPSSA